MGMILSHEEFTAQDEGASAQIKGLERESPQGSSNRVQTSEEGRPLLFWSELDRARARVCVCACMHVHGHGALLEGAFLSWARDGLGSLYNRLLSAAGRNPRPFSLDYYFPSGVLTFSSGCVPEHVSYKSVLLSV